MATFTILFSPCLHSLPLLNIFATLQESYKEKIHPDTKEKIKSTKIGILDIFLKKGVA